MKIIDLSRKITEGISPRFVPLEIEGKKYQGVIYDLTLSSMSGTYIDFPGHIAEFDNGLDATNYPWEDLFLVETTVLHLDRQGRKREIEVSELTEYRVSTPGLLINTGWKGEIFDPDVYFYSKQAIDWIVQKKIRLFLSDVYENHARPQGIFVELFKADVATVCLPTNLDRITRPVVKICVLPLCLAGATQVPCRVLAIED